MNKESRLFSNEYGLVSRLDYPSDGLSFDHKDCQYFYDGYKAIVADYIIMSTSEIGIRNQMKALGRKLFFLNPGLDDSLIIQFISLLTGHSVEWESSVEEVINSINIKDIDVSYLTETKKILFKKHFKNVSKDEKMKVVYKVMSHIRTEPSLNAIKAAIDSLMELKKPVTPGSIFITIADNDSTKKVSKKTIRRYLSSQKVSREVDRYNLRENGVYDFRFKKKEWIDKVIELINTGERNKSRMAKEANVSRQILYKSWDEIKAKYNNKHGEHDIFRIPNS